MNVLELADRYSPLSSPECPTEYKGDLRAAIEDATTEFLKSHQITVVSRAASGQRNSIPLHFGIDTSGENSPYLKKQHREEWANSRFQAAMKKR